MSQGIATGDYVEHPEFGLGKVLSTEADQVRVYFKTADQPDPDKRVRVFRIPNEFLSASEETSDIELDNLPPWKGDHFERARTTYSWDKAKATFARLFPQGLNDPKFIEQEVLYKRSAHGRYIELRPQLDAAIAQSDAIAVATQIDGIYGSTKAAPGAPDERLNVMFHQIDEPAYFSALRSGGEATIRYAAAALAFIDTPTGEGFCNYAEALAALPRRRDGLTLDAWTTATWLPFIADPQTHFLIKPTIVQAFASVLPFDIRYRPQLNFETYSKVVAMADRSRQLLAESELNLQRREIDLIDVQSFMWVVERYAEG